MRDGQVHNGNSRHGLSTGLYHFTDVEQDTDDGASDEESSSGDDDLIVPYWLHVKTPGTSAGKRAIDGPRPHAIDGPRPHAIDGPRPHAIDGPRPHTASRTASADKVDTPLSPVRRVLFSAENPQPITTAQATANAQHPAPRPVLQPLLQLESVHSETPSARTARVSKSPITNAQQQRQSTKARHRTAKAQNPVPGRPVLQPLLEACEQKPKQTTSKKVHGSFTIPTRVPKRSVACMTNVPQTSRKPVRVRPVRGSEGEQVILISSADEDQPSTSGINGRVYRPAKRPRHTIQQRDTTDDDSSDSSCCCSSDEGEEDASPFHECATCNLVYTSGNTHLLCSPRCPEAISKFKGSASQRKEIMRAYQTQVALDKHLADFAGSARYTKAINMGVPREFLINLCTKMFMKNVNRDRDKQGIFPTKGEILAAANNAGMNINPPPKRVKTPGDPREKAQVCSVCMYNVIDAIIIPCYHLTCCMTCLEQVQINAQHTTFKCPLCRRTVEKFKHIYWAGVQQSDSDSHSDSDSD